MEIILASFALALFAVGFFFRWKGVPLIVFFSMALVFFLIHYLPKKWREEIMKP